MRDSFRKTGDRRAGMADPAARLGLRRTPGHPIACGGRLRIGSIINFVQFLSIINRGITGVLQGVNRGLAGVQPLLTPC